MTMPDDLTPFVATFVDELVHSGVTHAVICPGSRSTPLAMLLGAHPDMKIWMNVDERSAGFFALGLAKAKKAPAVLLCSSGTASANFYPAIIEARYARVPLIVLTADRPHELRGVGAPQAIDQIKMYGENVKWFLEMPVPDSSDQMLAFIRSMARRSVKTAQQVPHGPVHLNFPFREPLIPNVREDGLWTSGKAGSSIQKPSHYDIDMTDIERVAEFLKKANRPLIVVGESDPTFGPAVGQLAETLGAPVLVDPLSNLRANHYSHPYFIDGYDSFLRTPRFVEAVKPDCVLRFGAMPVSKAFSLYLKTARPDHYIVIDEAFDWRDPTHQATDILACDPGQFCSLLSDRLTNAINKEWIAAWRKANEMTRQTLQRFMGNASWFEGHIVTLLEKVLPDDSTLFVGNSMPIRDIDTFFVNTDRSVQFLANRGANGIDGVVSTALGASVDRSPLYLLIGDLSFFHDMNGLMAAKQHQLNVTIIVINNNGGGIFSFLPQAEKADDFERLFATPLDIDIEKVASLYHAQYWRADDPISFKEAIAKTADSSGLNIIEAVTNRGVNTDTHRAFWRKVSDAIEEAIR